jgi:hypothetical protein
MLWFFEVISFGNPLAPRAKLAYIAR